MAGFQPATMIVSLDDESKELIRELVKAVNRIAKYQAPEDERSFAEPPKRLVEGNPDLLREGWGEDGMDDE